MMIVALFLRDVKMESSIFLREILPIDVMGDLHIYAPNG
jgi:hypothetical protein